MNGAGKNLTEKTLPQCSRHLEKEKNKENVGRERSSRNIIKYLLLLREHTWRLIVLYEPRCTRSIVTSSQVVSSQGLPPQKVKILNVEVN